MTARRKHLNILRAPSMRGGFVLISTMITQARLAIGCHTTQMLVLAVVQVALALIPKHAQSTFPEASHPLLARRAIGTGALT